MEHPTVIVVDDQALFRNGIIGLLEERGIRVIGEAGLAAEAIRKTCQLHPDVVLMDLNMPGMTGVEATQRLTAAAPQVQVLVLTVAGDDRHLIDAVLAGACGYLLKETPIAQIVEGIKAAVRGDSMISPRVASRLVQRLREPRNTEQALGGADLTPREHDVLELLVRGVDNPEIARTLYLSEHTVKHHVSSISRSFRWRIALRRQCGRCAVAWSDRVKRAGRVGGCSGRPYTLHRAVIRACPSTLRVFPLIEGCRSADTFNKT